MTESPSPAAERLFAALAELRQATAAVSYAMLVRQAAAQQPPIKISSQRLSDWFGGKAVPADPAVVRFLIAYLQPRVTRTSEYQQRQLSWWLNLHREALRQRQADPDERRRIADPPSSPHRLGRPINQCDPLALEVHPTTQVPGASAAADLLPRYVPRAHDNRLREVADQMLGGGASRLVTLVGGSSTGKTRACWELARYLDAKQQGRWRLLHPYDPTRSQAALADLERVGAYTIVWLNEAQHYLMPTDLGLGERIAAGLRTLLHDADRRPVLVMATLWPEYWDELTFRPAARQPDRYAQARDLLTGSRVSVADRFTPSELAGLQDPSTDARLREAVAHAAGGRITQYLAGAPELEDRYRTAPPAARAIIELAIDARRLGHPLALPSTLLEQAAPGYLDDHDWDALGEDWLEQALAYAARPGKGVRGPLTLIRPRPGNRADAGQPCYRLADYLEQIGSTERAALYPRESLWTAFASTVTDLDLLLRLGYEAEHRGRFQHAIWLYSQAADRGNIRAMVNLAELRDRAGDTTGAEALLTHAAEHGDAAALRELARRRKRAGDIAGAEALLRKGVDQDDPDAMVDLGELRERTGDIIGAETLYQQATDQGSAVGADGSALAPDFQLRLLRRRLAKGSAGAEDSVLPRGDVSRAASENQRGTAEPRRRRRMRPARGDPERDPEWEPRLRALADTGDSDAMKMLGWHIEKTGDSAGAEHLYRQALQHGELDALWSLSALQKKAGDISTASRTERFGLTGAGEVETGLDFGSYGGRIAG